MVDQPMKPIFQLLLLVGFFSLIPAAAHAQWDSKPYQQWTAKEAESLLTHSPWAQTLELRSALPLRQALARLRQLKSKYDKMSDSDKAALDAKNKPLLECPACADYYVIAMSPGPGSSKGVPHILQTMSLAQVGLNVQLKNEKGETRELVNFVNPKVAGEEAVFFFARLNSKGEPLINPANRTLTISFDPTIFEGATVRVTKFEFDVAKMTVDGKSFSNSPHGRLCWEKG